MLEKIKEKWEEILLHIKEEHELSDVSFKTWLLPTEVYSMKGDTVQILVPDIHFLGYMQKKYGFLITVAIAEITGIEMKLSWRMWRNTITINIRQEMCARRSIMKPALWRISRRCFPLRRLPF